MPHEIAYPLLAVIVIGVIVVAQLYFPLKVEITLKEERDGKKEAHDEDGEAGEGEAGDG